MDRTGAAILLNFIAQTEVGNTECASYDVIYGHNQGKLPNLITSMKLGELIDARTSFIKRFKLSASGRHQFLRATLQGLAQELGSCGTQVFDADLQDCLGYHLLIRRGQVTSTFSNAQLWDNTGASISIVQLLQARVDGVED